ncbi:MAG: hypothetical protein O6700_02830, partial [Gammaproteobacteria bacterium]|nr:hypothetical protein [Gammaproteobacteria bacterium]
ARAALDHSSGKIGATKRKPGGGNAGLDYCCYRSLRFQICGLAVGYRTRIVICLKRSNLFFYLYNSL